LDDFDLRVEQIIAETGWMVQGVYPTADQPGPGWCYTVGVEDKGGPEYLLIGLSPDIATPVLNSVVRDCLEHDRWWKHGDTVSGMLVGGYDMRAVAVAHADDGHWFNVANRRRRRFGPQGPLNVVQLVWPDRNQTFSASKNQPFLGVTWWT